MSANELTGESLATLQTDSARARVARILSTAIFYSLLGLVVVTAVPYGTVEAWWKAFFVCVVFILAIFWIIESYISERLLGEEWPLVLPMLALALFSFMQTIAFSEGGRSAGISQTIWNAISVDPYQTRFFTFQLLALILVGAFLFRYVNSQRRVRILINLVIGLAVAAALFGVLRQTTQHDVGFGLPRIKPAQGFAQFVNRNHFAYLMEMALGLILGLIVGSGVKRESILIYVAALLPIWTGVVVSGSRAGLIAMSAQVVIALLLFATIKGRDDGLMLIDSRILRAAESPVIRVLLLVVLIGGIAIGTIWVGGDQLATRIEESRNELTAGMDELRQGVSRKDIWRLTVKMFAAHPVTGVGMGAYWAAVPEFHDASGKMTPQEAHNDYLEILASGGLIGLTIVLWFVVVLIRRVRENLSSLSRFRRAVCFGSTIGIAGVAIHSLFDFGLHVMINAVVFTTLLVLASSKTKWTRTPETT